LVYQLIHEYDYPVIKTSVSREYLQSAGRRPCRNCRITDDRPQYGDGIMKALIAALALVTLIAGPTFAQSAYTGEQQPVYNASPASPDFGDNGN
jgi:hypothetical protein